MGHWVLRDEDMVTARARTSSATASVLLRPNAPLRAQAKPVGEREGGEPWARQEAPAPR